MGNPAIHEPSLYTLQLVVVVHGGGGPVPLQASCCAWWSKLMPWSRRRAPVVAHGDGGDGDLRPRRRWRRGGWQRVVRTVHGEQ